MDFEQALKEYRGQHGNARTRKIKWLLTFDDWVKFWKNSGRYHKRGRGANQFALVRIDPTGPYSLDNIHCRTNREASEDYWQSSQRPRALRHNKKIARQRRKPLQTPYGLYPSLAQASRRLKISESGLRWRILNHPKDYYYIT